MDGEAITVDTMRMLQLFAEWKVHQSLEISD